MINICEFCGQHSSQTAYELTTECELCSRCLEVVMKELILRQAKECHDSEYSPKAA